MSGVRGVFALIRCPVTPTCRVVARHVCLQLFAAVNSAHVATQVGAVRVLRQVLGPSLDLQLRPSPHLDSLVLVRLACLAVNALLHSTSTKDMYVCAANTRERGGGST